MDSEKHYIGRFAPSPTGPLHQGSLFAAVISYLEAKSHQGLWIVRIEDIDPLREQPGATSSILETLTLHGLTSENAIIKQSSRYPIYQQYLKQLSPFTYRCPCSRKQLATKGVHRQDCPLDKDSKETDKPFAVKLNTDAVLKHLGTATEHWIDQLQGPQPFVIEEDPVLLRKEGFYSYQLAVVVDDIAQKISHIVRGEDLLTSTPTQIALYRLLQVKPPSFLHFPVIRLKNGQKLSKQTGAEGIDNQTPQKNLFSILNRLSLNPPEHLRNQSPRAILQWATERWHSSLLNDLSSTLIAE